MARRCNNHQNNFLVVFLLRVIGFFCDMLAVIRGFIRDAHDWITITAPRKVYSMMMSVYSGFFTVEAQAETVSKTVFDHAVAVGSTLWDMVSSSAYVFVRFMSRIALYPFGYRIRHGHVCLNSGSHEVEIRLHHKTPLKVWLSMDDCGDIPICQGSIDKAGVVIKEKSFVIYADISSDSRVVSWKAVVK